MSCADGTGAFFDLDGTLLPPPSLERRFVLYLLKRGLIGPAQFARCAARFIADIASNARTGIEADKSYLAGVSTSCAEEWSTQFASHPPKFFSAGLRRLEFHFAQGHRIFLITGTPTPLAELIVKYLPAPLTIAGTQPDARHGFWTGEITGEHMCGVAKQRAVVRLAAAHGVNLARSFAYGNSVSDLPMLETVAHPIAVNPSNRLERIARLRAWPVLRWHAMGANPLKIGDTTKSFIRPFSCSTKYSSRLQIPSEQTHEHDLF